MSDVETVALLLKHAQSLHSTVEAQAAQLAKDRQQLDAMVSAMRGLPQQLGKLAYAGADAAVGKAVDTALSDAGRHITLVAKDAIAPVQKEMTASLKGLASARSELETARKQFLSRGVGAVVAFGVVAFLSAAAGAWGCYYFARSQLVDLRAQITDSQAELATSQTVLANMKRDGAALDAKGARFETNLCTMPDGRTKRLCVAVDPESGVYKSGGTTYYIAKGF